MLRFLDLLARVAVSGWLWASALSVVVLSGQVSPWLLPIGVLFGWLIVAVACEVWRER